MRVALLSYNACAGDAIGQQIVEKLGFFLDSGADVRVFVESDRNLHVGIRPHCRLLPVEPRGDGWLFLRSSDLIIVDYSQGYALAGLLPLLVGGRPRIVFDYHGVTPPELWGKPPAEALVQGVRQRGLVWSADAALVHSRFAEQELRAPTGFPAERTFELGYVVDRKFWSPGPPACGLRQRLQLGPACVLLYVGRLAANKRTPLLVEALARLRNTQPRVHAVLIGDDGDVYQTEAEQCRQRAEELGVADRLHILGRLPVDQLRDAYRSADVLVMPSLHEGFCIPVIEAMACGLPVVAARAAALPQTVGAAGLTFAPNDADDLVMQLRRVLKALPGKSVGCKRGIAIVSARYGDGFAGGAEASLRILAQTLQQAGQRVEVFTTCVRRDGDWRNELPEGTYTIDGITVHRFRIDPHDPERRTQALRELSEKDSPANQQELLVQLPNSTRLVEALKVRAVEMDAIIVGPYLSSLTCTIARTFPERTLVLPCFHDEPVARSTVWRQAYAPVAGLLYHSPEEQELAETVLGLNHPGAQVCGTRLETELGLAERGRALVGGRRYIVACGRYSAEKGMPLLLETARAYAQAHPDRFAFVFMGEGNVPVPRAPWAHDLGFVSDAVKRDVLAGADALWLGSERESLSLAALEAWAQSVPVIGLRRCAVLAGHVGRGAGGWLADDARDFPSILDVIWEKPDRAAELGRHGREYVRARYGAGSTLGAVLERALQNIQQPLAEQMRQRGFERAARFDRPCWRERFAALLEQVLDAPAQPVRIEVEIEPRTAARIVSATMPTALIPVRVTNRGTHAVPAEGPARVVLRGTVTDENGQIEGDSAEVALPELLVPGQTLAAAVPVVVPAQPGSYRVAFHAESQEQNIGAPAAPGLTLTVAAGGAPADAACCAPLLENVQAALARALAVQQLPDDYRDEVTGRFAALKRWLKRKLLGNFKRGYVDVLSRQQTAFNRQTLAALQELAECCATLDHARAQPVEAVRAGERMSRQEADAPLSPRGADTSRKKEIA